ncbi:MAG: type II secretion system protein M [Burkholderiales bacterium]|nr:type II secretion system protein M [Burkholderiales bacterium]
MKFWKERSEREKRILFFSSIFLTMSLLYAFVWEPGEKAGHRLRAELPQLRAKALKMREQAAEIEKLKTLSGGRATNLKADISAQAQAGNMGLSRIEIDGDGHAHVEFAAVSFDNWILWLDKLRLENHIRLESGHIQKLDQPGMVKINASFAAWG